MNRKYNITQIKIDEIVLILLNLMPRIEEVKDKLEQLDLNMQEIKYILNKISKFRVNGDCNRDIEEVIKNILEINDPNKYLLVKSNSKEHFRNIREIFDIPKEEPVIMAGPCAVENVELLEEVGQFLRKKSMKFLRGGAFKPRTSPYDFQGLGKVGLKILHDIATDNNLFSITEVVDIRDVELVTNYVDLVQIGARNMQNFQLLKEIGRSQHPVLLKRGMSATINELINAAEYIAAEGNRNIILCERGIRTYETETRNTLDIAAIPILKKETQLSVIADVSHSLGRKDIVNEIVQAVLAVGADGIMVEVHPNPPSALSDNKQQLNLEEFQQLLNAIYDIG